MVAMAGELIKQYAMNFSVWIFAHWILYSFSPAYDDEPEYDPDEPVEPFDPEVETNGQIDDIAVGQNPDQLLTTGDRGVVISGDPVAAANRGKGGDKAPKDKKIPHDQRTTTPYMTKYERARILGTRALQIRWVLINLGWRKADV
jgi:DNA-directed RNA polymerase I, II, and III subunit RPABC2